MKNNEISMMVSAIYKHCDSRQNKAAEYIGIEDQQTISAWIKGRNPNAENAQKIREAYNRLMRDKNELHADEVLTKEEAAALIDDIIESPFSTYKTALAVSVRAYHKAVQGERRIEMMDDTMRRMESRFEEQMAEMESNIKKHFEDTIRSILGNVQLPKRETPLLGGA